MDTVQPLQEHWTPLVAVRRTHPTPAPVSELVAELQPLTLDENTEPLRTDSLGYTGDTADSLGYTGETQQIALITQETQQIALVTQERHSR